MASNGHQADETDGKSTSIGVDRRSVLKGLGIGSVSLFGYQPAVAQSRGDRVEIVTAKRPNENEAVEVATTEEVPRRWYNQLKRARRVNQRIKDQLMSADGIKSIGITSQGDRIGEYQKQTIRVRRTDEPINTSIPDHVDGIPVHVEEDDTEARLSTHGTCTQFNNYDRDYDPVKGGAIIEGRANAFADDGNCNNIGTACCRMMDLGTGTYYLMTAHHLVDGCGAGDVSGQSVYQHADFIGPVAQSHKQYDVVLVGLSFFSTRSGFSDTIVETSQPVSGFVNADGVATMASKDETVSKRGVRTGDTTATVDTHAETLTACGNTYHDQIEYKMAVSNGGDSGGPYFTDSGNGYNLLVGMNSAEIGTLRTSGVAAYRLNGQLSLIPT